MARPLSPKEKKNVMAHLTHDMKPIREEEISQVEMNEEFGLAGKMMLALLFQWLNAENRKAMDRLLRFYHPLDKAMLIYAMLLYVTTGKRVRMNNAVAQRHYNLMVEFVDDGSVETYKIVTTVRGHSLEGLISNESPLGKALLGKKEGDVVHVQVNPSVGYEVKIVKIENTVDDGTDQLRSF